ncbi:MAG: ABC transporter ATP-binding protein [Clostridiales bacterium]|nr:ABC transporter ATP-binding protein [Clostridiales bacterium]
MAETAIGKADEKFLALREEAITQLQSALPVLGAKPVNEEELKNLCASLGKVVNASINPIDIVKDSAAYTFAGSFQGFVNQYFTGKRTNGQKIRKYEKELAKYNRLVEKGKNPDWQVAAASVIDLDQVQENIVRLVNNLIAHYQQRNAAEKHVDLNEKTVALIDYLKENASGMVLKITKQAAKNKALKLMEEVGIPEPRKRYRDYPFQFSGGMRQRIVIAIALAANPDILICDEPTTALDVTIQAQILELINRLKKQRNLSIIFITHDLGVVANMADRIAVMYAGKIVEYGTSEEIFYEPAHPYTWALLSSMPDLDTKEKLEAIPGTPPDMIYPPKGDAFAQRNRYAMKIDFEKQPPAFPISDTHWAATWLLHPNAPKVEPPKTVTERIARMKARMGGEANV